MKENTSIDGAEYITLKEAKRLKLPFFENVAAGFPMLKTDANDTKDPAGRCKSGLLTC